MRSKLWIGSLALAGLVLAGCGSRPEAAPEADVTPAAAVGAEADVVAVPLVDGAMAAPGAAADRAAAAASASPGKPRAPIEAAVVGRPALQSGVPGKVTLEIRPGVAVDGLSAQVTGDATLAVVGQAAFRFGPLAAGEAVRVEVAVTPTSGGVGRLSALLTLDVGGQPQARPVILAFEIGGPVTLQAPAEKPAAPPVRDAAGELIHSMPAETTERTP